jgi:hypothetical protein
VAAHTLSTGRLPRMLCPILCRSCSPAGGAQSRAQTPRAQALHEPATAAAAAGGAQVRNGSAWCWQYTAVVRAQCTCCDVHSFCSLGHQPTFQATACNVCVKHQRKICQHTHCTKQYTVLLDTTQQLTLPVASPRLARLSGPLKRNQTAAATGTVSAMGSA